MSLEPIVRYSRNMEGKITIATALVCVLVFSVFFLMDVQYKDGVKAGNVATTSVVVLNSPPEWQVSPAEVPASSSSSPTNEGDTVTWTATAYDPNGANGYWLLICKTSPATEGDMTLYDVENEESVPDCPGGETWAISELADDDMEATAVYQTQEGRVESEENAWYAVICDNDDINPRCNVEDVRQGDGASGSPFYVNHRPLFTELNSPDPVDPGDEATWTSIASNDNSLLSDTTVRLFVCRTNEFDETGPECVGGEESTYASSTLMENDPQATYTTKHPKPNGEYEAYGFVIDAYGLTAPMHDDSNYGAEERMQGTNAYLEINNVAPELLLDSVNFFDYDNQTGTPSNYLTLINEEDETHDFRVEFQTSDANSCVTRDWESGTTTGYMEMVDVAVNVYRSGVGVNSCYQDGHYDPNNCYPFDVASSTYDGEEGWNIVCTLDNSGCSGNTDTTVKWECTFPLWYIADPTDGGAENTPFHDQNWVASVVVTDVDEEASERAEGNGGVDVSSFLAFRLGQDSIAYGEMEAGDDQSLDVATPIFATGNTGVDQELEGTPMCPGFDLGGGNFGCTGYDLETVPIDTIPARFQKFAVGTGTLYDTGTPLADRNLEEEEAYLALNVLKSTVVFDPQSKEIGWGIMIPSEIQIAGNYRGQNTFIAVASAPENW